MTHTEAVFPFESDICLFVNAILFFLFLSEFPVQSRILIYIVTHASRLYIL